MADWYFRLGGRSFGPYDSAQFAAMALDGRLQATDLIRRSDRQEWTAASTVRGLTFADEVPPPLPIPQPPASPSLFGIKTSLTTSAFRSTRCRRVIVASLLVAAVACAAMWGAMSYRNSPGAGHSSEPNGLRLATPADLDVFQLKTAVIGTFADSDVSPTRTFTFSDGSWRARGPDGSTHSGVSDFVYLDGAGKPSASGRAGFALLLMRLVVGDPATILPARPYLGPTGKVDRLEIDGLDQGPLASLIGARLIVLHRVADAPPPPSTRFSRPIVGPSIPSTPPVAAIPPSAADPATASETPIATPAPNATKPSATPVVSDALAIVSPITSPATNGSVDRPRPSDRPGSSADAARPTGTPSATAMKQAESPTVVASLPVAAPIMPAPAQSPSVKLNIKLVRIAAGEFWMGSSEQDRPSDPTEKPRHRVRLTKDFELAAHETTVGQFRKFVEATGYQTTVEKNKLGGWQANWSTSKGKRDPQCTWRNPGFPQTDEHPVTVVSHDDAAAFCRWLSAEESAVYRLPAEAEWEYACRAGSDGTRHSGSEPLASFAWDSNNSEGKTHPVGMLRPNAWGVYDLYGNVREWCSDHWQASYVAAAQSDPIGPATGAQYSWRGGSWQDGSSFVRSAKRAGYQPAEAFNNLGFRVVREVPKP